MRAALHVADDDEDDDSMSMRAVMLASVLKWLHTCVVDEGLVLLWCVRDWWRGAILRVLLQG